LFILHIMRMLAEQPENPGQLTVTHSHTSGHKSQALF
jgi:hypothetical protein